MTANQKENRGAFNLFFIEGLPFILGCRAKARPRSIEGRASMELRDRAGRHKGRSRRPRPHSRIRTVAPWVSRSVDFGGNSRGYPDLPHPPAVECFSATESFARTVRPNQVPNNLGSRASDEGKVPRRGAGTAGPRPLHVWPWDGRGGPTLIKSRFANTERLGRFEARLPDWRDLPGGPRARGLPGAEINPSEEGLATRKLGYRLEFQEHPVPCTYRFEGQI